MFTGIFTIIAFVAFVKVGFDFLSGWDFYKDPLHFRRQAIHRRKVKERGIDSDQALWAKLLDTDPSDWKEEKVYAVKDFCDSFFGTTERHLTYHPFPDNPDTHFYYDDKYKVIYLAEKKMPIAHLSAPSMGLIAHQNKKNKETHNPKHELLYQEILHYVEKLSSCHETWKNENEEKQKAMMELQKQMAEEEKKQRYARLSEQFAAWLENDMAGDQAFGCEEESIGNVRYLTCFFEQQPFLTIAHHHGMPSYQWLIDEADCMGYFREKEDVLKAFLQRRFAKTTKAKQPVQESGVSLPASIEQMKLSIEESMVQLEKEKGWMTEEEQFRYFHAYPLRMSQLLESYGRLSQPDKMAVEVETVFLDMQESLRSLSETLEKRKRRDVEKHVRVAHKLM